MTTAAWSTDEQEALTFTPVSTGVVKIQHLHVDELDADRDSNTTIGEFRVEALRFALLAPLAAEEHVAVKAAKSSRWTLWRGRFGTR